MSSLQCDICHTVIETDSVLDSKTCFKCCSIYCSHCCIEKGITNECVICFRPIKSDREMMKEWDEKNDSIEQSSEQSSEQSTSEQPIRSHFRPSQPAISELEQLNLQYAPEVRIEEQDHEYSEDFYNTYFNNNIERMDIPRERATSEPSEVEYITERIEKLGLENIGNSCYLNAALQLFIHSTPLVHLIIEHINEKRPLSYEDVVQLRNDYAVMMGMNTYEQCDSSFFIQYLLDKINDKLPSKRNQVTTIELTDTFKCSSCNQITTRVKYENMFYVYPKSGKTTLMDLMVQEFKEDMSKKCEHCSPNINVPMKRLSHITDASLYMYFSIQKTMVDASSQIDIPLQIIHNRKFSYGLEGFIEHHGSVNFGHYVAYIKDSTGWHCYNDERVTRVSEQEIENKLIVKASSFHFISFLWYSFDGEIDETEIDEDSDTEDIDIPNIVFASDDAIQPTLGG